MMMRRKIDAYESTYCLFLSLSFVSVLFFFHLRAVLLIFLFVSEGFLFVFGL